MCLRLEKPGRGGVTGSWETDALMRCWFWSDLLTIWKILIACLVALKWNPKRACMCVCVYKPALCLFSAFVNVTDFVFSNDFTILSFPTTLWLIYLRCGLTLIIRAEPNHLHSHTTHASKGNIREKYPKHHWNNRFVSGRILGMQSTNRVTVWPTKTDWSYLCCLLLL